MHYGAPVDGNNPTGYGPTGYGPTGYGPTVYGPSNHNSTDHGQKDDGTATSATSGMFIVETDGHSRLTLRKYRDHPPITPISKTPTSKTQALPWALQPEWRSSAGSSLALETFASHLGKASGTVAAGVPSAAAKIEQIVALDAVPGVMRGN